MSTGIPSGGNPTGPNGGVMVNGVETYVNQGGVYGYIDPQSGNFIAYSSNGPYPAGAGPAGGTGMPYQTYNPLPTLQGGSSGPGALGQDPFGVNNKITMSYINAQGQLVVIDQSSMYAPRPGGGGYSGGATGYQQGEQDQPGPGGVNTSGGSQAQRDALASLQKTLNQYGLGSLAQWAWGELTSGVSQDQVLLDLQNQPAYKQRFPALDAMRSAGLPVLSPADYLRTEADYKRTMRVYGINPSSNPADYTNLFTNQVSAAEFDSRLKSYHSLQTTYGPYVKQQFEQYAGMTGISDADLYKLLSGQDDSLAVKYAQNTGQGFSKLSFADIQDAESKALEQNKGEFMEGGTVEAGLPAATQRTSLIQRELAGPGLPVAGA